ncbi:MAG TPA: glucose-6-phosphate isomerase, partial [Gammaproteobacteria bacterium]|nr:glucose-6-phosphate isomerase [Gammaproteobacteria bacterium]
MTIWTTLQAHRQRLTAISTEELNKDEQRLSKLTFDIAGCHFDLSRQRFDQPTLNDLVALADEANVASLRDALFTGEPINVSENRAVLHMALRGGAPNLAADLVREIDAARQKLYQCAE